MSCDVGKATEGLENELWNRWSDGKVGEWAELIKWRICDVGEAKEGLENELWRMWSNGGVGVTERLENRLCSFSNISVISPTSQLILQPFRRFTYVTAHSPTLPLFQLRHSSFSNTSFASTTSQALHLLWVSHFLTSFLADRDAKRKSRRNYNNLLRMRTACATCTTLPRRTLNLPWRSDDSYEAF